MASRCSCSEVWLEKRSEQQAVRPSLFIREEMMLQPQPHIDLLISSLTVLGVKKRVGGKRHKLQSAATSWSLLNSLSCPHSLFCNVFHMVLIHRYSVTDMSLVLSTVNIIQTPTLTLIHSEGTWVGKYSLSVHFPRDCFPLTPLPMLYFYV